MSMNSPTHRQTTEGGSGWIWQTRVNSFLLLPGDMVSAAGGCELATTTCENRFEEVYGVATCSLIPPLLIQYLWSCVQLMGPECEDSCKRDLAQDKSRSTAFTAQRQGHDQTDLQCKVRGCGYCQIKRAVGSTWDWWPRCYPERRKGFAGLDTLNYPVAQLRQFATCR